MSEDSISAERKAILRGLGSPRNPIEREFQVQYVRFCGLDKLFPPTPAKVTNDHDYEGAILARQERLI